LPLSGTKVHMCLWHGALPFSCLTFLMYVITLYVGKEDTGSKEKQ